MKGVDARHGGSLLLLLVPVNFLKIENQLVLRKRQKNLFIYRLTGVPGIYAPDPLCKLLESMNTYISDV